MEYADRVKFIVVESDNLFSLAQAAQVETYPTMLFFKNRDVIDSLEQEITIQALENKLHALLA